MATPIYYIEYVLDHIKDRFDIRYKKMFGEYMIYINNKPILLVCDSTVFIKKNEYILEKMKNADVGIPYKGAKEHYILDVENIDFCKEIISILEKITPLPKPKNKNLKIQ